ncbi:endonuclease/exonuclease/phosphatase family protein [Streptomyces turgidiscabies]|jgi:Exonuclease III|uniref:Endonuclease/exonuclease n=2 Tax=Streptomyces TaxID=1883 RepID=L7F4L8_STRT8|nr:MULTISPECIES: endonuclease/exonuclease/phosphatase family protein [Streptomyces]ELP65961.1 endonuclease/exonuclease [Streptomyces turgidiscabies Car8]MDX3498305.1 endonuclease/exonuclease/phosphatase family protein [Streptomyces turgidiscabies]GAQ74450.1 endonuclease/exonuclease/phosphatase family protein [Streptomyces turgidiscabies]
MTITVRLGTYNLLNGGGERWRAQAEFLRAQNLDVLCLQEAKRWDEGGYARMLGFAELLGMQAQFAPSNSHNCHLVTLYRWPRVRCTAFHLDVAEGTFHHVVSRAHLTVDGRELTVLNTHLAPFSGSSRSREADWLTEYGAAGRRVVLAGDLNVQGVVDEELEDWGVIPAELHSRHRSQLADGSYGGSDRLAMAKLVHAGFIDPVAALGIPVPRTAGYWSDAERWDHRSDHILLAPDLAPALTGCEVPDTEEARGLSDHLPFIVTLELPQADAALTPDR